MSTNQLKQRKRAPSAKSIGRGRLPNKRLVCNKKSTDGSGKANLIDSTGDTVWGVLYEIDSAELHNLDKAEIRYTRMGLDVITDEDSLVEAWLYVSSELTEDARPYDWYKQLMVNGAREHGLPASYVKYLERIPTKPTAAKERSNFR